MNGYGGNILYVDLSTKKVRKEPVTKELCEKYIGGEGFAMKLANENIKPGVEPLSPDAPIIVGIPALGGTFSTPSGKTSWIMKFPVSGDIDKPDKHFVGCAVGGSTMFPIAMKNAGYDAMVITGKADKLSYLNIVDDNVEICDADAYRGRSPVDVNTALRRKYGMRSGVVTIGEAGEKLINWSLAYQDIQGTVGRHGAGAVFGSKNLKAICVNGTKGVKVADAEKLIHKSEQIIETIEKHPFHQALMDMRLSGYSAFWSVWEITLSQGNWFTHKYGYKYSHEVCADKFVTRVSADACCPLSCKCSLLVPSGPKKGTVTHLHALQVPMLAERLEIEDLSQAVELATDYNNAGLCGMTFMSIVDWVTRLYSEGKISKESVGFELKRDFETYEKIMDMILKKEGIGDVLGQGYAATAEYLGVDPRKDTVMRGITRGHDPIYDARMTTLDPLRWLYVVCPRPNHAGYHDITTIPGNVPHLPIPLEMVRGNYSGGAVLPDELEKAFTPVPYYGAGFNVGLVGIINERNGTIYNCLGACSVPAVVGVYHVSDLMELWSYASGYEKDVKEVVECADRIYSLYRDINAREGFGRKDDWVESWFTPRITPEGPLPLTDYYRTRVITRDDMNKLLDDYYEARGWDVKTGNPTKERLTELKV